MEGMEAILYLDVLATIRSREEEVKMHYLVDLEMTRWWVMTLIIIRTRILMTEERVMIF